MRIASMSNMKIEPGDVLWLTTDGDFENDHVKRIIDEFRMSRDIPDGTTIMITPPELSLEHMSLEDLIMLRDNLSDSVRISLSCLEDMGITPTKKVCFVHHVDDNEFDADLHHICRSCAYKIKHVADISPGLMDAILDG